MTLPTLRERELCLRPARGKDLDLLTEAVALPGVREWWGPLDQDPRDLREGLANDGCAFVVEVMGEVAGWVGFNEETEPGYRHAGLDVFLAPRHQGHGVGPRALRLVIAWLIDERGHHRCTIDPALANARAIKAYEAVGFRRVGVMRRYERGLDGSWHDSLLMDLLAEEFQRGGG